LYQLLKNLHRNYKILNNVFNKGIGVMFRSKIRKPYFFKFRKESIIPLHMWFVFTPIDVLFLNKDLKIVEIKKNFRPFSYYTPKNKAKYIIELPPGSVNSYALKKGQKATLN